MNPNKTRSFRNRIKDILKDEIIVPLLVGALVYINLISNQPRPYWGVVAVFRRFFSSVA